MNKTLSRLFIFFVGLPLVLLIVFLNYGNHLPLHLLIIVMCGIASSELYTMFRTKTALPPKPFLIGASVAIPIVAAIIAILPSFTGMQLHFGAEAITYALVFVMLLILAGEVLTVTDFAEANVRMAASVFIVLYAGFLLTFVSRMTTFHKNGKDVSNAVIAVFLLMVFLCDSLAWFFGVLFGKNNKGVVRVSPNKSIAGFAGGFVGSILSGCLGYAVWPDVFSGSIVKIIVTGVLIAISSIVGDLAESLFKRSSGLKDSGNVIPGRGGVLDSIDSIVMSAPIYYLLVTILYGPFL